MDCSGHYFEPLLHLEKKRVGDLLKFGLPMLR